MPSPRLRAAQRAGLEALRRRYVTELPEKAGSIQEALADLEAHGWDRERLQSFCLLVHRLTGSASMYGFGAVGATAAELEAVATGLSEGVAPPPSSRTQLTALVERLVSEAARADLTTARGAHPGNLPGGR